MTLLIKGGQIVKEDASLELRDIFISEGKIKGFEAKKAETTVDASGLIILPGMIDCHVHFREPGLTNKEDFFTGSCAAAAGAVTTIMDMPNTKPPTITAEALEQKRKLAKKSIVNYGLHFGTGELDEMKKAENVASVKVYMDFTTGDLIIENKNKLQEVFNARSHIMAHAEGDNVKVAIELIKNTDNSLHLAHISTKEELEIIKKEKNDKITVEVTPHHLFLNEDDARELKGFGVMKPSLKTKQDQEALWQAIEDGIIDTIGSDHAPHTKREKQSDNPPFGVPGVETTMPLLLNAVNEKRLTLKKVMELTSENPAKIFGLKTKGKIKVGYDADLMIIDMNMEKHVDEENLFTKCKWSPFKDWPLKGWPVCTIVNANVVFEKGNIVNDFIKGREVDFNG